MAYDHKVDIDTFKRFYCEDMVSESFTKMMEEMDQNQDGAICHHEFVDYYTNMSPVFNEDKAFKEFLYSSWGLN